MSETSGLSADLSPERREPSIVQRIVNAWDCCGTCAGGVLAAHVREERAKALEALSADLYRNHDMPPNKDGRSYSYRNGWWDGVHHAAKVAEKAARADRVARQGGEHE